MSIEVGGISQSIPVHSNRNAVDEIFKQFDIDKTGELNLKEALESGAPDEKAFRLADADGSGSVSKEELLKFFDAFDKVLDASGANPQNVVAALGNGDEKLIKELLQAARSNDDKGLQSILDKLVKDNKHNTVDQGALVNLSA